MAQTASSPKIAADLRAYVTAVASGGSTPSVTWVKNLSGQPHVKVLVNAASTDATPASQRQDILARGGSVLYNYISVPAVSATVTAAALDSLAGRVDLNSISPTSPRHAKEAFCKPVLVPAQPCRHFPLAACWTAGAWALPSSTPASIPAPELPWR